MRVGPRATVKVLSQSQGMFSPLSISSKEQPQMKWGRCSPSRGNGRESPSSQVLRDRQALTVLAKSLRTAFLFISCNRMSMSNFLQCWIYSWLPSGCLLKGGQTNNEIVRTRFFAWSVLHKGYPK